MDLLYISNNIDEVKKADEIGIDFIFIDLEINGKKERQRGLDTFISNHNIEDIKEIRKVLKKAKLLVRINPIGNNSKKEIDKVIEYGADVIMLPMFKTKEEVEKFVSYIDGRVKVCLLLETATAFFRIDDILSVKGIDYIHIGLNDLHLSLGLDFMFECLIGDLMEHLIQKIKKKEIKFGIGGIARMGEGELSSEIILKEHVRLGSEMVILSRTFRDGSKEISEEIQKIRDEYNKDLKLSRVQLIDNKKNMDKIINRIAFKRRLNNVL
ncbi:aldolase/citrate lyase family protein [Fusobacterium animalis]|uniref:aldolase/citrate lyase family protein n=1 Tax=Fusobacterium animalis TaxID=76859 RepID=UPI0030CDC5C8